MKKAILTLGYPASGKSTFLNNLNFQRTYKIFDSDNYNASDHQQRNKMMVQDIIEFVRDYTSDNIIIVATAGGEKFNETLQFLKYNNFEITIMHFKLSKNKAIELNNNRFRKVPQEAFDIVDKYLNKNIKLAKKYSTYFYQINAII